MNEDYQKGYQKGYSKGYSTGKRISDAAIAEALNKANNAAKRAERAEKNNGIGHCESCAHWSRGGGIAHWQTCAWGICGAPRAAGTPWGTYANVDDNKGQIQTSPRFGCVLFVPAGQCPPQQSIT